MKASPLHDMHSRTLSRHVLSRLLLAVVLLHALLGQSLHQALHLRADALALATAAAGLESADAAFAAGEPADADEQGGSGRHEGTACAWCLAHADNPLLGGAWPTAFTQAQPQPQLAQPTPGVRVPTSGFSPFAPRGPPAALAASSVRALA